MKILVIEDKPALTKSIAEYLAQENHRCEFADTCAEALHRSNTLNMIASSWTGCCPAAAASKSTTSRRRHLLKWIKKNTALLRGG